MAKKIVIDDDLCIGCGACESTAPEYFELGNDGKAHVKKQYDEEGKDKIEDTKTNCPGGAIEVKEEKE